MGTVITNLKARFGLDSGDFKRGASEAQGSLLKLDGQVQKSINSLTGMLSPMALLGAAGGALYTLKESIEAVEGPGDRFEAVIGGGKEALFEMQRALATMDFSNLIRNIAEAYGKGKEFAELLDELKDKKAYSDYVIVGLEQEAEALREISKNKQLEITERAAAAEQIKIIESQILARKKEILKESFDIEKQQWELRNKMSVEEGVKLFESIHKIQKEGYGSVSAENVAFLQKIYEGSVKADRVMGTSVEKATKGASQLMKANLLAYGSTDIIKNIPKNELEYLADIFARIFTINEKGEADVWVKLFDTINKNAVAVNEAQQDFNAAIKETSTLLAREESATGKAAKNTEAQLKAAQAINDLKAAKAANNAAPIAAIPQADISSAIVMPDFFEAEDKLAGFSQTVQKTSIDISGALNQSLGDMSVGIGEFIGALANGDASAAGFGSMIAANFADMAITVGKIAIATGIATSGIKAALESLNPAVAIAAGIALVALGSAVKGALSSAASGGSGGASVGGGSSSPVKTYGSGNARTEQIEKAVFNTESLKLISESIAAGFAKFDSSIPVSTDRIVAAIEALPAQLALPVAQEISTSNIVNTTNNIDQAAAQPAINIQPAETVVQNTVGADVISALSQFGEMVPASVDRVVSAIEALPERIALPQANIATVLNSNVVNTENNNINQVPAEQPAINISQAAVQPAINVEPASLVIPGNIGDNVISALARFGETVPASVDRIVSAIEALPARIAMPQVNNTNVSTNNVLNTENTNINQAAQQPNINTPAPVSNITIPSITIPDFATLLKDALYPVSTDIANAAAIMRESMNITVPVSIPAPQVTTQAITAGGAARVQTIDIRISGRLTADQRELVALINNETARLNIVT